MTNDPTLAAFSRLREFATGDKGSALDRLTVGNTAAWLAHATTYGITGDTYLLRCIADPAKSPVERARTLTRSIVQEMSSAGLPLSAPFQSVDLLYSAIENQGEGEISLSASDPFEADIERGPKP
ncbi:hypothetical protein [Pontivivens nitratireducens]|uniref:hypothetical protein n=1 Tax=Pontivivens nitratireducens TaxID=2758038 RepID=UPI00197C38DD|nr:hypothetical protein [Pontibrevibacter nitratireducens]